MRLLSTGYGAGKMDLPIPNVVRLLLGEGSNNPKNHPFQEQELVCLESNIDNMNPEVYAYLSERLCDAGAMDVSLIPIYMKKNRPGTLVTVLCSDEISEKLLEIILSETTTLGARKYTVSRYSVERYIAQISTPYGDINVKFSKKGEKSWNYAPEYEDCRRLASQLHIPILEVYRAAENAAEKYLNA
jgi:hypothetical protein